MTHLLLIIAVVILVGCPASEKPEPTEQNSGPKAETPSPVTNKPDNTSPPKHTTDSLELVQNRITKNEAILVDVREKLEWEAGHLHSAIFLPLSKLEENQSNASFAESVAKKLPKDKIVYCHCAAGGRVMPASAILHKLGYDVRPLKTGYKDLLKTGFKKAE